MPHRSSICIYVSVSVALNLQRQQSAHKYVKKTTIHRVRETDRDREIEREGEGKKMQITEAQKPKETPKKRGKC